MPNKLDPLDFALFLMPGCAFEPAAYFTVKLHLTSDRDALANSGPVPSYTGCPA